MMLNLSRLVVNKFDDVQWILPAYNSTADFDWIQHQSNLPWLKLAIAVPTHDILQETASILPYMSAHRDDDNEHKGWKSFCIHGKSFDATREDQFYNDARPHVWTEQAKQLMPRSVEFFRTGWPASTFSRVRMMLLEPGGYIALHSDSDDSKLSAINIAITQPAGCKFVMENHGRVPFSPGDSFWLDLSNKHTVFNDSDQHRWHIIVHQDCNDPKFKELVVKCYHDLYNTLDAPGQINHTG